MGSSTVAVVVLSILVTLYGSDATAFPEGFTFGACSAAYQVEGAWNVSDKGESYVDRYIHTLKTYDPSVEGANGDVACDSYHLWERDVEIASELGLDFYRFTISWSRLLPNGFNNIVSEDGTNYYNNLIDGLLAKGIEPVVTLHHLDLPQRLQDLGGWTNPLVVDWFTNYARVAFSLFGDRVKTWITISEPTNMCDLAYELGVRAPGIIDPEMAPFLCNRHVLLAHAHAYKVYDEEFRSTNNGVISLSNDIVWYEPYSSENEELTELARQYFIGCYTYPIFSAEGGWPPAIEAVMKELSTQEGYSTSRLQPFTDEEIALIKGSADFFAFGYFTTHLVRAPVDGEEISTTANTGLDIVNAIFVDDSSWPVGANTLNPVYPEGLRNLLAWLKENFGDLEYFVNGNGYSTDASNPDDDSRISFIQSHLEQILLSVNEDGVNVKRYGYWALMDHIRWTARSDLPYRYGLYEVDFASSELTRTARGSAEFFKNIISTRALE